MSCNYADGLSPYHDKGQLGLEEKFDSKSVVSAKVSLLTKWINEAKHVVVHTGAGISTSAGIPDFRGPRGVWTLQEKGEKPDLSKDFNEAIPTVTHMAIMKLVEREKVKYVVSQNIDGLHLRSNLQRKYLSELHGNMFTEQCNSCNRQFVRSSPVPTVGQKSLNKTCPATKANGRPCRGRLHDTILDWEHNLPENDLGMADYHSCLADLSISLGTTMQIVPSGNLPLYTKRNGGKLVIVNLQPTKHDRKANLLIHSYVDDVMTMLMKNLGIKIPKYAAKYDPTRTLSSSSEKYLEWTISDNALKKMKKIYEEKCGSKEARKRLEMIYDDVPLSVGKNLKRKVKEEEDSDLEVLDVIVKPKRTRESSRRTGSKRGVPPPSYNTTITIKKVTPPPKKSSKYDGEKITIKKNVTPTKTKYEIVTKSKKFPPKCEITYSNDSDLCNDLDMICESDDEDEMTNNFTYNFKMYLRDEGKKVAETDNEIKTEFKNETKSEEERETVKGIEGKPFDDVKEEIKNEDAEKERETKEELSEETSRESGGKTEEDNTGQKEGEREESKNDPKSGGEERINESVQKEKGEKVEEEKEEKEIECIAEISSRPNESGSHERETEVAEKAREPEIEPEETMHEEELKKLMERTGDQGEGGSKEGSGNGRPAEINEKPGMTYRNLDSELSNLSNSNLEVVSERDSSGLTGGPMESSCNENSAIDFYNNEYNSSNTPGTDFDNLVGGNYYNNF